MNARALRVETPRFVLKHMPAQARRHTVSVLVIGGGAAGLAAALQAAQYVDVIMLTRTPLPVSNSSWAQGGIAAALSENDSPQSHIRDTVTAGAGLSDLASVTTLAWEAPVLMYEMANLGVPFDREQTNFVLGLEGGHSHRRIVHVGDATGRALTNALIRQAREHTRIRILEGYQVVDLLGKPGRCTGVLALDDHGVWHRFDAYATILATGGIGALYSLTSNQSFALGEGIAMAYRAGAEVADMEFVQFHPTVFRSHNGEGFLISEATRGEGGRLLTADGWHFMPDLDPRAELAPRDVVTRGIYMAMQRSGADHVLLDLTHLTSAFLEQRFPTITARCRTEGIDPANTPIPVAPAAHYLMGGIRTDLHGATSLGGLYAAGECACTGAHGANRLASNSLLECLVFGRRTGVAAAADSAYPALRTAPTPYTLAQPTSDASQHLTLPDLQNLMRLYLGPARDATDLRELLQRLDTFPFQTNAATPTAITLTNAALIARLSATSALLRNESRGAHFRSDYPHSAEEWRVHSLLKRDLPARTSATIIDEAAFVATTPASIAMERHEHAAD